MGIEAVLAWWEFDHLTTMLLTTAGFQILQFIGSHYNSPEL